MTQNIPKVEIENVVKKGVVGGLKSKQRMASK